MCLIKKNIFPRISSKPITCYKYVCRNAYSSKQFMTAVRDFRFFIGDTIKNSYGWFGGILTPDLNGEVVHAYTTEKNALDGTFNARYGSMCRFNKLYNPYCYIECEIPPFTPYWISEDGSEIGAARIKTIKVG